MYDDQFSYDHFYTPNTAGQIDGPVFNGMVGNVPVQSDNTVIGVQVDINRVYMFVADKFGFDFSGEGGFCGNSVQTAFVFGHIITASNGPAYHRSGTSTRNRQQRVVR